MTGNKRFSLCVAGALLAVLLSGAALPAHAAEWYVSSSGGSNQNAGNTPAEPFKNLQKAIKSAAPGDTIKVAAGNYYGLLNKGSIDLDRGVTILGGFNADFSQRDILGNPTLLQPSNKSNDTYGGNALLYVTIKDESAVTVIDGLMFDKGPSNNYHQKEGLVEGVTGGMLLHPPSRESMDKSPNAKMPLIGGTFNGSVTIRNCVFVNGNFYGIQFAQGKGSVKVLNNIFIANALAAAEIRGSTAASHQSDLEFAYNTVLFSWSRLKDLGDMGYGVRIMTQMDYNIHHNIIGFSCFAGLDATRDDKNRYVSIDHNALILNRQADLTLPGGGMYLRVWAEDFADLELKSTKGNKTLNDFSLLADKINKPYTIGFLDVRYKEKTDLDENSPSNRLREMLGQPKRGQITSQVSMYGNYYPLTDAVKLFGAVEGVGAQKAE